MFYKIRQTCYLSLVIQSYQWKIDKVFNGFKIFTFDKQLYAWTPFFNELTIKTLKKSFVFYQWGKMVAWFLEF